MTYAGIQMFMEKLKQLINCNHIPFINNHPEIISQRPQFQLLYDELGSMIQTLSIDQHRELHDIEKLADLKRRFIYAAEEAEYILDLFLSGVHKKKNNNRSLDDFRRLFKSIEVEFMTLRIENGDGLARRLERIVNQSAPAQNPNTENSLGKKKLVDEIFVGLDCDVELIRDKLVEDQKKLHVVSIVGMGGIGKTTLATKVFKDGYVKHHFHVRVWITVSQTYDKRVVLLQILESIRCQLNIEKASDARLRELVHKNLIGKRYLIVIDDIWHTETWDSLKLFFPQDNNGSRILLTSRLTEVAKHANSNGLIHHLGYLNNEESWELLCQKVFHGNKCPEWSTKPGMKIIESCKGLPLAVVVIAGVLAKEAWSEKFWVEIAESTDSYIVDEENGCLEALGLSYNQLPRHLRECFLYFGGFPEDDEFEARWLIFLWVAEGFVQQDGNRSVEDIAEGYLLDLIDRNLVIVVHRSNSNGGVKTCKVHDLIRELCEKKAKEEQFNLILTECKHTDNSSLLTLSSHVGAPPVRMLTSDSDISFTYTRNLRSLVLFGDSGYDYCYPKKSYFQYFRLLRVLYLQQCEMDKFPRYMKLLVHLRYLAILKRSAGFPSSICNLWNLQTLIYNTTNKRGDSVKLPSNISDLVNLRHLLCNCTFVLRSIEKPMNLQTISNVMLGNGVGNFHKWFPYIKELTCTTYIDEEIGIKSLTNLKKLNLTAGPKGEPRCGKNNIAFPATLKTLTLAECRLPWSDMSIIQSLPNLQVLKLETEAFEGSCWNTEAQEFQQLKFLRLKILDIKQWEAYTRSFPCLKQLEVIYCYNLEEIPFEIGDIPTLELIRVHYCSRSVGESVKKLQGEQHDLGNYDLEIDIFEY